MADLAALVVDAENLNGMVQRAYGREFTPDPAMLLKFVEGAIPGRVLLWTRWYLTRPYDEATDARERRQNYYHRLRNRGIRVVCVEPKPISLYTKQKEQNTCDFEIVEGINLACLKASTIVVASGDGHLAPVIANAHERFGCRTEILCDREGCSSRLEADRFHFLDDVSPECGLARVRKRHVKAAAC